MIANLLSGGNTALMLASKERHDIASKEGHDKVLSLLLEASVDHESASM